MGFCCVSFSPSPALPGCTAGEGDAQDGVRLIALNLKRRIHTQGLSQPVPCAVCRHSQAGNKPKTGRIKGHLRSCDTSLPWSGLAGAGWREGTTLLQFPYRSRRCCHNPNESSKRWGIKRDLFRDAFNVEEWILQCRQHLLSKGNQYGYERPL